MPASIILPFPPVDPGPGPPETGGAGRGSLLLYRRALGRRIGPFRVTRTTDTPTGFEPDSLVVASALADDDEVPDRFRRAYVYVVNGAAATEQQRLRSEDYEPSAGAARVAGRFSQVLSAGTEIELARPLPSSTYGEIASLNRCVVQALESLTVQQRLPMLAVGRQVRYALDGLPWVLRREQVTDVYAPIPAGMPVLEADPTVISRGQWDVVLDADRPYLALRTPFPAGQTFFVGLRRPASSWIAVAGVWGDSTTGPTADSDQALYDVDTVVNVAVRIAYARLTAFYLESGEPERAGIYAKLERETAAMSALARFYQPFRTDGVQRVGAVGGYSGVSDR